MPPRTPQYLAGLLTDIQTRCEARGGVCLETKCVDLTSPMRFKCARGHRWSTPGRVIRAGSWCPACSGHVRATLADAQRAARAWRGKLLSREASGTKSLLRWRCADGHEWEAPLRRIREGRWCPRCAGRVQLSDLQAFAAEHGGRCLSKKFVDGNTPMDWECAAGHRFTAIWRVLKIGEWCTECKGRVRRLTIKHMREWAARQGGECLSPRYFDECTHLRWRCAQGHEWLAQPATIRSGRWCSKCGWRTHDLDFVRKLAWERGGQCLAEKYVNCHERLPWQCRDGHVWWASTSNVFHNGSWCRRCSSKLVAVDRR